jgi:LEA14-like dessication related protein
MPDVTPLRLVRRSFLLLLAIIALCGLNGCAGMLGSEPIRVTVAGLEPLEGQGLEMRFNVKLRVQNPNNAPVDYDGVSLDLALNGKPFASGVSDQRGSVPRYGEAVLEVPVTVSAFTAARQVFGFATGTAHASIPYALSGRLGGALGGTRFSDKGSLDLPAGAFGD